jgi:hypothetical protein
MLKTAVIVQSNYIPWKGYFDLIRAADQFVIYDSVQYTRRDWRNRNLIKTPRGLQWLTVAVNAKGNYHSPIDEVTIADADWTRRHLRTLEVNYRPAAHFDETYRWFADAVNTVAAEPKLSRVNEALMQAVCTRLRIATPLIRCTSLVDRKSLAALDPTDRLVALCRAVGASRYLSGPSARSYMNLDRFNEAGIDVAWADYDGYPEYAQLWGPFEHRVSVLDLLFNTGRDAGRYLKAL